MIFLLHSRAEYIPVSDVTLNLPAMLKAKDKAVFNLTRGVEGLLKANKVDYIQGAASFLSPSLLSITPNQNQPSDNPFQISSSNVIIATGSEVAPFPGGAITIDEERIVSSTGALELKSVPKKMAVIGGGIIGLEMGSVWSRLGAEVTVIEYLGAIGGAGIDGEVAYVISRFSAIPVLNPLSGSSSRRH